MYRESFAEMRTRERERYDHVSSRVELLCRYGTIRDMRDRLRDEENTEVTVRKYIFIDTLTQYSWSDVLPQPLQHHLHCSLKMGARWKLGGWGGG